MASVPTWAWLVCGWVLIALGAWLILTGRGFTTRRKGRHCRKCGYDMAGLLSRTCPECGRTAASEKELCRSLRRGPWRAAGVMIAVGGWVSLQVPAVRAYGWAATLPDVVLASVTPIDLSPSAKLSGAATYSVPAPSTPPPVGGSSATYGLGDRIGDALCRETWRRLVRKQLGRWSAEHYLRRAVPIGPNPAPTGMPARWAVGALSPKLPPVATASIGTAVLSAEAVMQETKDPSSTAHFLIQVYIGQAYTVGAFDQPIDIRPHGELMDGAHGPELDQQVADALSPHLQASGGTQVLVVNGRTSADRWVALQMYMCVRVGIVLDGREIGHDYIDVARTAATDSAMPVERLPAWEEHGGELAAQRPDDVTFVLSGDLGGAATQYMHDWTSPPTAWDGHATVRQSTTLPVSTTPAGRRARKVE